MLIAEGEKVDPIAEAVTAYLGRRLVERERALSSLGDEMTTRADTPIQPEAAPISTARSYKASDLVFMLAIGMLVGAAALYGIILWKTGVIDAASVMGLFRKAGG